MAIRFYDPVPPNGWLSNFSNHPIRLNDQLWPTIEHFYQAQRYSSADLQTAILSAPSPGDAKRLGQQFKARQRPEWDAVKRTVMLTAIRAKFAQHPDLRRRLLETGNQPLIEAAADDPYWGSGPDGNGHNHLGELLMRVRDEARIASERE